MYGWFKDHVTGVKQELRGGPKINAVALMKGTIKYLRIAQKKGREK